MFKYIKTINAHCAAPEISEYTLDGQHDVKAGSVMFHNNYGLSPAFLDPTQSDRKYFVIEDFTYDEKKPVKVKAVPITPGMIFETETNIEDIEVGLCYLLTSSFDGNSFDTISNATGHGARIFKVLGGKRYWVELDW